jgi:hypothetical protein
MCIAGYHWCAEIRWETDQLITNGRTYGLRQTAKGLIPEVPGWTANAL